MVVSLQLSSAQQRGTVCGVAAVDECIVVRCVAAHSVMCRGAVLCSVMWQHSLVPRPSVFCPC